MSAVLSEVSHKDAVRENSYQNHVDERLAQSFTSVSQMGIPVLTCSCPELEPHCAAAVLCDQQRVSLARVEMRRCCRKQAFVALLVPLIHK